MVLSFDKNVISIILYINCTTSHVLILTIEQTPKGNGIHFEHPNYQYDGFIEEFAREWETLIEGIRTLIAITRQIGQCFCLSVFLSFRLLLDN